jgi:hypothetical protein
MAEGGRGSGWWRRGRRAVRIFGWGAAVVLVLGALVDRIEAFDRAVVAVLRARLGAVAGDLQLVDADVDWLTRTLVLRGLVLDLGRREVFVDTLRLRMGWHGGALALERAEWSGGEVLLTRAMLTALEGRAGAVERDHDERRTSALPTLFVQDVAVALETPDYGDIALGRCDLALRPDELGVPRLTGRFVPSFEERRARGGEIWLTGALRSDGTLEARGTAHALRIVAAELPAGEPFDALRPFAPEFLVEFEGRGRLVRGESVLPELDLGLRIADGRLELPHLGRPDARPLRDVEIVADATFRPSGPDSLWSREAWQLSAAASALWESTRLSATARFGASPARPTLAEASLFAHDLELGEALLDLGGHTQELAEVHSMLAPDGRADVFVGLRLPRDWKPGEGRLRIEQGIAVLARGGASMAYHGSPSRPSGVRDQGFPLRVERLRGLVTWTYHPADEYPVQLGMHALEGHHAGGPVHVVGSLHEIPGHMIGSTLDERHARRPFFPSLFHLRIQSERLAVDSELEAAFAGLAGVKPVGEIFADYGLAGGALSFMLQLWRVPGRSELATDITIDLHDVGCRWRGLPVPVEGVDGLLCVRTDGGGEAAGRTSVSIDARGTSPAAHGQVTVRGRSQSDGRARHASAFEVVAAEVNTRSALLRDVLLEKQPAVLAAVDTAGLSGFVDVAVTTSDASDADGSLAWITAETTAGGVRLLPATFANPTEGVHGRVAITTLSPESAVGERPVGEVEVAVEGRVHVQGHWPDTPAPVALVAFITFGGIDSRDGPGAEVMPPVLSVAGAGLDITNRGILGSVGDFVRAAGGSGDPLDPTELDVAGRFDFQARFELPDEPGGPPGRSSVGVDARLERLGVAGRPLLSDVAAHFRLVEESGVWIGERISAELGSTPIRLTDLRWTPSARGSLFTARLAAEDLPLDRDHLSLFVDRDTLDKLLEDLALRGTIDVLDSRIEFERGADAVDALRFRGSIDVDDMALVLGIPLELSSVDEVDLELSLEGENLRARASVAGLRGLLAGRQLEDVRVQVAYADPRLSFAALEGNFEGGRISSITGEHAQFFALDLAPPFPFDLSARLSGVDVGEFLQGTFNSDFANEGRMDLDLTLGGDIEHLTGLEGNGRVVVDETRLWAIPVFQALFARLGFPTTAVFKRIEARFHIADGVLHIDRTRADSDLLSVVGSGTVDFDGDVSTDLEVRYGLVDRLGPLRQLLYKIQNSLLRVSVRGTMERPVVVLRGLFSQFFRPAEARDRLPLPGFSELPKRF